MATDAISTELRSFLGLKAGASLSAGQSTPADSVAAPVDEQQVISAVSRLQAHFAQRSAPPELSFDYLSGLSVVTVRAANSGELLYQMPGIDAVRLARLVAGGAAATGMLDTSV